MTEHETKTTKQIKNNRTATKKKQKNILTHNRQLTNKHK